jgi:zinc transport system ATP-binding protein
MSLITCENLTLAYDTGIVASGVSFTLHAGDYLCIVGENGSGKSTLLKSMLGLHPVSGGRLTIDPETRKSGIGYLPQHTPAQRDFPASVREIVRSGCLRKSGLRPFWRASEKALADKAMARMGIDHLEKQCYRELSGGQQQRVLLARAFCATGQLILLDEPIAGLDPLAMKDMYEVIADMNKPKDCPVCDHTHNGVTVVMVSHDIHAAVKYASHILHLDKDTAFFGKTADYLATPLGRRFAGDSQEEDSKEVEA